MSREECQEEVLKRLAQIQEGASLARRNLHDPGTLETLEKMAQDSRVAMAHLRLLQGQSLV